MNLKDIMGKRPIGSLTDTTTNYFTTCSLKTGCNNFIWLRGKSNLTREEQIVLFEKAGWQLFPSRCPDHLQERKNNND